MNLPLNWTELESEQQDAAPAAEPIPWEDPESPLLIALIGTIKEILFRPAAFFRQLSLQGGLSAPLNFALIVGSWGILASLYWQFFQLLFFKQKGFWPADWLLQSLQLGPAIFIGISLLAPLLVALNQYLGSLLLYWALRIAGKRRATFEATFRVTAYANAAMIVTCLPVLGGIFAYLWNFILLIKGLGRVFDLSTLGAFLIILLTCFFHLGLFGIFFLVFGALLLV
jgi:hypothetical protein